MKTDIIGDIHGCYDEFFTLTKKLGYDWSEGIPVHPDHRKLSFVGDLTDRGPHSLKIIEIVWKLWQQNLAFYVPGNHCNKLYRYFIGRNVQITHGLETTVAELKACTPKEENHYKKMFIQLYEESPLYQILNDKKLIIAHAGIREDYIGQYHKSVKTFVLYGDITGEKHEDGSPVRRDWAKHYTGSTWIVYGHTPVKEARFVNHTVNIDTGAVFGGKLTALRYPEMEIVSVVSSMPYVPEKFRTFAE
ncbi:bis(5'-nucleosyl)-tetraphosphatase PrpE [Heyndrickxia sp. NPDC080065]|uniref:bis(5'-nucleosyl)-tetraphosphatase PrpE n=1 Tax=Heyndrickxia sp. NPDC080065 TaxID=3390568 RepID=UPI003CFC87DF